MDLKTYRILYTGKKTMSAAHSIPDVLVSKITLMAYALSPHPLAVMIKDSRATWEIYCQSFIPWGSKRVKWINIMQVLVTHGIKKKHLKT